MLFAKITLSFCGSGFKIKIRVRTAVTVGMGLGWNSRFPVLDINRKEMVKWLVLSNSYGNSYVLFIRKPILNFRLLISF